MHCWKCGSEIAPGSKFCHNCGEKAISPSPISADKSSFKKWFIPLFLVLVGLVVVATYYHLNKEDMDSVIVKQIKAIQANHLTEAYYEYTTKDFQHSTTLEAFRDFLNTHPIFKESSSIHFTTSEVDDKTSKVHAALSNKEGAQEEVLYNLVLEGDKWKIQYIQISGNDHQALSQATTVTKELVAPIESQLKSLQEKDYKKAYEGSASKDFRAQTSYDQFKTFVDEYPILTNFIQYGYASHSNDDKHAEVTIILNPGQENIPVRYKLVKEGGQWKVWSLQIVLPPTEAATHSMMHPKELGPPVIKFLKDLHESKIDEAYKELTSEEFKKNTDVKNFHTFLEQFPILTAHTGYTIKTEEIHNEQYGQVLVEFKEGERLFDAEFTLNIENGIWKVAGIQIINAEEILNEKVKADKAATSSPGKTAALAFNKILMGNQIDQEGNIVNASDHFSPKDGELFVNVFVENGQSGENINLAIKHLNTGEETPPVSQTLDHAGDSTEVFYFTPPGSEWPEGNYELVAKSSTGARLQLPFQVTAQQ